MANNVDCQCYRLHKLDDSRKSVMAIKLNNKKEEEKNKIFLFKIIIEFGFICVLIGRAGGKKRFQNNIWYLNQKNIKIVLIF